MANDKLTQLENLKALGVDPKRVNGVMVGLTACFNGGDTIEHALSRIGKVKGEVAEKQPRHASVKKMDELHAKTKILFRLSQAAGGILELIEENKVDPTNPGELKLKPEFLAGAKALNKVVAAGGTPDIEAIVADVNVLLNTGLPKTGLAPKSVGFIDSCKRYFSGDAKLLKLVGDIGGPGTLDNTFAALQTIVATVKTPANPAINPTGTNPKPGENTPS